MPHSHTWSCGGTRSRSDSEAVHGSSTWELGQGRIASPSRPGPVTGGSAW
jgi:hypothetical protein